MNQEFSDEHFARMNYNQLEYRVRNENESIADFGEEIKKLSRLAFPSTPIETRDRISCSQFIRGLKNRKIQYQLRFERITSLRLAVERATELDAIDRTLNEGMNQFNSNKRKFTPHFTENPKTQSNHNTTSSRPTDPNKKSKIQCFHCNAFGHYASECKKRDSQPPNFSSNQFCRNSTSRFSRPNSSSASNSHRNRIQNCRRTQNLNSTHTNVAGQNNAGQNNTGQNNAGQNNEFDRAS